MKPNLPDPWVHFSEAFRHFERGWEMADKAFDELPVKSSGNVHTIQAATWARRLRMFRLFSKLAVGILVRGKVTIKL